jgi:hypothetical protein
MTTSELIADDKQFTGAKYRSGYSISTYDDGFGPLWISRNPLGINGWELNYLSPTINSRAGVHWTPAPHHL